MLKILDLIRHTENDDVSGVLQRLIYIYEDEIVSFAAEMLKHLVIIISIIWEKMKNNWI